MSALVTEVDLAQPLDPIPIPRRHGAVWVLVRRGRRALGWVRHRRSMVGTVLHPDALRTLIGEQLPMEVVDSLRCAAPVSDPDFSSLPVSVIVCTREHPGLLRRQLQSLSELDYPNYEVIVVDNAPVTNGTRDVCAEFPQFRYVVEPRKGLDFARNTGWRCARGAIVSYTDDDARVDRHWLKAVARNFSDPDVHCVTGNTLPMELESPAQDLFEEYGGMQRGFRRRVFKPGRWSVSHPLGSGRFGAGVNLSLRRTALEEMNGFDNALDVGSLSRGGGDLDIMARVLINGGQLVYEPSAIVWHQHRPTMKQLRRQMFDYGFGFSAYLSKHTRSLELANRGSQLLKWWSKEWGIRRLKRNLMLALKGRRHFPVHLILLEFLGGVLGWSAYPRARARARILEQTPFTTGPRLA